MGLYRVTRLAWGAIAVAAMALSASAATHAQVAKKIKIGVIYDYSGPLAGGGSDLHALGAAHQRGQRGGAQRGVRVAAGGGRIHVRHQPGVRAQRGRPGRLADLGRYPGREPADALGQRRGHRRADLIQRVNRRLDGLRPGRQLSQQGLVPLLLRCVVAVVAGQVQRGQVRGRAAAVQFEVA